MKAISTTLTSHSSRLLFSWSHLRILQICLPVLRFKQFAQLPQFSLRRQGPQSPHFFLLFFWRSAAVSGESSKGEREKSPACWCSVSMYLLRGDVFSEDVLCEWGDRASSAPVGNVSMSSGGGPVPFLALGMAAVLTCLFCVLNSLQTSLKKFLKMELKNPNHPKIQ